MGNADPGAQHPAGVGHSLKGMVEQSFSVPFEGVMLHASAIAGLETPESSYALFLHGGGAAASSEGVRYLRDALADQGVASVAFDFSGHGRSGGRLEGTSLQQRRREALAVVERLAPLKPRALVATSMAGHTACCLIGELRPEVLILFCPAAYEARAEDACFGEAFRNVIRSTQTFDGAPAFAALNRFTGRLLVVYGAQDEVIPRTVQDGYMSASAQTHHAEFIRLEGARHRLHDWLCANPQDQLRVSARMLLALSRLRACSLRSNGSSRSAST